MSSRAENRIHLYKRRDPLQQEARRKKIAAERREQRVTRRTDAFAANRRIQEEPAVSGRQQRLEEWKRRQVAAKAAREKKPAFVYSKITYNDTHLYKPFESITFNPPKGVVPVQSLQPERLLRSHSKNQQKGPPLTVKEAVGAFASAMAKATSNRALRVPKPQIPIAETKNATDVLNRTFDGTPTPKKSAMPDGDICLFKFENTTKIEMDPNVLKRENQPAETPTEPIPTRKSRRKSTVQKDVISISSVPQPEATEKSTSVQGTVEQPAEKSADYFRSLYSDAVAKLNGLCNAWTNQQSQGLPDSIRDDIDVAVGYAQLLISQRLQQFLDLIVEHEDTNSFSELKVLSTDLDGFWGIVNNQLEDIYRKFDKLETMKVNNWQDSYSNSLPVKGHSHISKKPKITKSKGNATSGLRSFLAQARRQAQTGVDENNQPSVAFDTSSIMSKPMSPVVMRVASRAKLLGSPQTLPQSVPTPRSALRIVHPENIQTPKSTKTTPALKRTFLKTPGSTPMRRSARILSKVGD